MIFFVSTFNSKGGVLCSAIVSERLKMTKKSRNSWETGYTISGVELSNNVISINEIWRVLNSLVTLHYFSL